MYDPTSQYSFECVVLDKLGQCFRSSTHEEKNVNVRLLFPLQVQQMGSHLV